MTLPRAGACLFAPRIGATLLAMGLALAWAADAHAGCAGRAHRPEEARAAAAGLSAEVVGEPAPMKPAGCTGAFCSRPSAPAGADVRGGVDLRAESWAFSSCLATPAVEVSGRIVAVSDDPLPPPLPDVPIDPPR